jgi:hypothetical protein
MGLAAAQLQHQQPQQQDKEQQDQEHSAYAQVAPSLLPGLSAKILAGFAAQQQQMDEDDYDDDYDS